jgi:hypothetical protein
MIPDDIDDDALSKAPKYEQFDVMETWFRERFEDPAERTPYDSGEGGFQWIWGGPHDARYELHGRFDGIVVDSLIDELASDLTDENVEWAPTPQPGDYDEGLFDAVSANDVARQTLEDALTTIASLLLVPVSDVQRPPYHRLLFANVISALETYLSDTFINAVFSDTKLLQKYIENDPAFKDRKVSFRDLRREAAAIEDTTRKELLDVVWHNLAKVIPLYKSVLSIDLGDVKAVAVAIQKRHDVIHRNGKGKDGVMVSISSNDITKLIDDVSAIADAVEATLGEVDEDDTPAF